MLMGAVVLASGLILQGSAPHTHRQPRFYAFASGYAAIHPANGPIYHRVSPALGGVAADIAAGAGGFLNDRVALEGEFVLDGDVSKPQRFSYFTSEDYIAHSRDMLFNELLRFRTGAVQLVAGGGYARRTTRETSRIETDALGKKSSAPDSLPYPYQRFTWTAGLDVVMRGSVHVAIAPSFRLRWIDGPPRDGSDGTGIGNYTVQFGVTVFFR